MDHSTFTYLMAPGTGFLEFYGSDATPRRSPLVACSRRAASARAGL